MDRAGQETLIMNLYRHIDRNKFQFDFLCTTNKIGDYDDEIKKLRGIIYYLPQSKITIPHLHNLGIISNYRNFFKKHPEYRIVHFHNYHAFSVLIQVLGAKLGGVKSIIVHSHNTSAPNSKVHKIVKPILKLFNIYRLACSKPAGKWMYGNSKFKVLNNGINTSSYLFNDNNRLKIRKELGIDSDTKLICHIGRFNYQKNHKYILDIFSELLCEDSNFQLILIGKGELELEIEQYAETLGIKDKILFAGIREDIPDILSGSDVFLFPSIFEGLGIVMIEAQANGIPIVCSSVIPEEAILCNNIKSLSLLDSLSSWVQAIRSQAYEKHDTNNQVMIYNAGYDILDSTSLLSHIYNNV